MIENASIIISPTFVKFNRKFLKEKHWIFLLARNKSGLFFLSVYCRSELFFTTYFTMNICYLLLLSFVFTHLMIYRMIFIRISLWFSKKNLKITLSDWKSSDSLCMYVTMMRSVNQFTAYIINIHFTFVLGTILNSALAKFSTNFNAKHQRKSSLPRKFTTEYRA